MRHLNSSLLYREIQKGWDLNNDIKYHKSAGLCWYKNRNEIR